MNLGTLAGALNLPVVERLRAVHNHTRKGTKERLHAALPVISELEASLEPVINGVGFGALLAIGRAVRKDIPSAESIRVGFARLKSRLRSEPQFVRYIADTLPEIAARYSTSNIMSIVRDPDFLQLLGERGK